MSVLPSVDRCTARRRPSGAMAAYDGPRCSATPLPIASSSRPWRSTQTNRLRVPPGPVRYATYRDATPPERPDPNWDRRRRCPRSRPGPRQWWRWLRRTRRRAASHSARTTGDQVARTPPACQRPGGGRRARCPIRRRRCLLLRDCRRCRTEPASVGQEVALDDPSVQPSARWLARRVVFLRRAVQGAVRHQRVEDHAIGVPGRARWNRRSGQCPHHTALQIRSP